MRVVFMGTPEFAVPALRALNEHHSVAAVYTRPDAVSGRGSSTRFSPVKEAALELGLSVFQPATLRDPDVWDDLRSLAPDAIIVAAYGLILPPEVLSIAPHGAVNVHASLLPRWRGAAPIQRAILAGDPEVGVSIMQMEEGLDTGAFCVTRTLPVGESSTTRLTEALATAGADALIEALDRIAQGTCDWLSQDPTLVTYAEKIAKADVALDPTLTADQALRRIRASSAQAPSRMTLGGKALTALEAHATSCGIAQGAVALDRTGILIGLADGAIELTTIKPDGKAAMRASDWARGARVSDTTEWGPIA